MKTQTRQFSFGTGLVLFGVSLLSLVLGVGWLLCVIVGFKLLRSGNPWGKLLLSVGVFWGLAMIVWAITEWNKTKRSLEWGTKRERDYEMKKER